MDACPVSSEIPSSIKWSSKHCQASDRGKGDGRFPCIDLTRPKHMPSRHAYRLANDDRHARDSALTTFFEFMCSSADCTQRVECSDADVCEGTRDDTSKYPERCTGVVGSCSPPTGMCPLSASFRAFLGGRCESESEVYVGLKNALLAVGMVDTELVAMDSNVVSSHSLSAHVCFKLVPLREVTTLPETEVMNSE